MRTPPSGCGWRALLLWVSCQDALVHTTSQGCANGMHSFTHARTLRPRLQLVRGAPASAEGAGMAIGTQRQRGRQLRVRQENVCCWCSRGP